MALCTWRCRLLRKLLMELSNLTCFFCWVPFLLSVPINCLLYPYIVCCVCLSFCLLFCLYVYLFVSVSPFSCLSACLPACLSVCQSYLHQSLWSILRLLFSTFESSINLSVCFCILLKRRYVMETCNTPLTNCR